MDPTYAAEYEALGLTPLDEWIRTVVKRNRRIHYNPNRIYDGIGASTWMCIAIIAHLRKGQGAILLAPTMAMADFLRQSLSAFAEQLQFPEKWESTSTREARFINGATLIWAVAPADDPKGRVVGTVGRPALRVFHDALWKERAIRRARGPFEMIREIRFVHRPDGEHFLGYAEDEEFVCELTGWGAAELIGSDSSIVAVGFRPDVYQMRTTL